MRLVAIAVLLLPIVPVMACVGDDPAGVQPVADGGGTVSEGGPPGSDGDGGTDSGPESGGVCPSGLTDCDGDGVCDVALASDPENCGACGRSCGGTTCSNSTCLAKEIRGGLDEPLSLAVNASSVMWARNGALESCAKTGCNGNPALIAKDFVLYEGSPRKMFATDAHVFWIARPTAASSRGNLYRCEVTGCIQASPTVLEEAGFSGLVVANSTDFFRYELAGSLYVGPIDASAPSTVFPQAYSETNYTYGVDDAHLAWFDVGETVYNNRGVYVCSLPCTKTPTRILAQGRHVAVRGGVVYASRNDDASNPTASELFRCEVTGCGGSGTNLTVAKEGVITDVIVDDTSVYWLVRGNVGSANGAVRACSLPDCKGGPRTLASDQAQPVAITQDADFVYWANRGTGAANTGSIQRVRK